VAFHGNRWRLKWQLRLRRRALYSAPRKKKRRKKKRNESIRQIDWNMGENCLRISTHTHVPVHQPAIYGKETAAAALDDGGGGGSGGSCMCTRWHMATSIPPKKSWRCYFAFVIEDYQYVAVIGT
jgi:hypothetical protein